MIITPVKELNTRFGKLNLDLAQEINFSEGIIGLSELKKYVVVDAPQECGNLKILQSTEDEQISFITLPLSYIKDNLYGDLIQQVDIEQAANSLNIATKNLVLLLIINLKKMNNNEISAFINVRAPIFIDSTQLVGYQYILSNNNYEISKKL